MIKIAFVCKANEERSPTAEAFANEFIKKNKLYDKIQVSSRGVYVEHIQRILKTEDIHDKFVPNLLKVYVIECALKNGIFNAKQIKKAEYLLTKGNFNQIEINELYLFAKKEAMRRTREIYLPFLEKKGLKVKYYHPEHLMPDDYDYIIPLLQDESFEVEKIFYGTGYTPKIVLFHKFIGIKNECPIVVTSGDLKVYESLYGYMKENVPRLMKKILEVENAPG